MTTETLEEVCARIFIEQEPGAFSPDITNWQAKCFREKWFAMQREAQDPGDREPLTTLDDQFYTRDAVLQAMQKAADVVFDSCNKQLEDDIRATNTMFHVSFPSMSAILAAMPVPQELAPDTPKVDTSAENELAAQMREVCAKFVQGLGLDWKPTIIAAVIRELPLPVLGGDVDKEDTSAEGRAVKWFAAFKEACRERNNLRGELQQMERSLRMAHAERASFEAQVSRLFLDKAGLRVDLAEVRQEHDHLKEDFGRVVQENRDALCTYDTNLRMVAGQRDAAEKSAETFAKRAETAEFQRDEIGKKHNAANADISSLQAQLELTRSNLELAQLGEKNALSDYETAKKRNAQLVAANAVVERQWEEIRTERDKWKAQYEEATAKDPLQEERERIAGGPYATE